MNTILVGLMTLMPAIVSVVVVIGVPVALGALLLSESRWHKRHALYARERRVPAGYIRDIYHRTRHPELVGGRRRAIPA
jgi:hypothetical protein